MYGARVLVAAAVSILMAMSCGGKSVKKQTEDVLNLCAENEMAGALRYFGPASGISPGAVFTKRANDSWGLRFLLSDMVQDTNEAAGMLLVPSTSAECNAKTQASAGLRGRINADVVGVVDAALLTDLGRSDTMTASLSSAQWVELKGAVYDQFVRNLPGNTVFSEELLSGSRYVVTRALLVEGMKLKYIYSGGVKASLSAETQRLNGTIGEANAEMSAEWTNETTLEIKINSAFYIVGELTRYDAAGGTATTDDNFKEPVPVGNNARWVDDRIAPGDPD